MKKLIALILALVLTLSFAAIVVCADDDYVPSPELSETESETEPEEKNGCFSVVGSSVVAIAVTTIAAAAISLKKKED